MAILLCLILKCIYLWATVMCLVDKGQLEWSGSENGNVGQVAQMWVEGGGQGISHSVLHLFI